MSKCEPAAPGREAAAGHPRRHLSRWSPTERTVSLGDEEYPVHLRGVPAPPERLAVAGRLGPEDALAVALVGSRSPTPYGAAMAERLAGDLARRGVTVVSGLARGIDIAAHRGALAAGGRSVAVLGSGIDVLYPPEHEEEACLMVDRGAVISQFARGAPPLPAHFPVRNRVIAGLSLAVVVVEAAERSGALITAGLAGDLGREVMAVPGRATSAQSWGAHRLLREGAALVESWQDVVAQLPRRWQECLGAAPPREESAAETAPDGEAGERERLLRLLGEDALGMDDLIAASGMAPSRVAAAIGMLEIDGLVRRQAGQRFVRTGRPRRPDEAGMGWG